MSRSNAQPRDSFALERRERIWRLVNERGRVRTFELAQLLQVTEPTIRKDIIDLEAQSLLTRTHGGAVARRSMAEIGPSDREQMHIDQKRAIAHACVDLINDGEAVFLDGGTTNAEIAKVLTSRSEHRPTRSLREVKVLTNSFRVAEICAARPGDAAIVLGGRYRADGRTTVGPLALSALRQFHVDIAFIGVTGITEEGFSASDLAEAQIKIEAIDRAARTVVPLDSSKVGQTDFVSVCPLDGVQTVVTDRAVPSLTGWLADASVELCLTAEETKVS